MITDKPAPAAGRLRQIWRNNRVAVIAFCATFLLVFYFGFQTISQALYWHDPAHQDQALAGWMTPRYVAQSYHIPPHVLEPALFLEGADRQRRISLDTIAQTHGVTLQELQDRIDAAAAQWRSAGPRPGR